LRSLGDCLLYGIVDLAYVTAGRVSHVTEQMLEGGVDIIQLRGKMQTLDELTQLAATMHALTTAKGTPLIVNDHAEIAVRAPVEGVHVGQDDDSVGAVRAHVGRPILVGRSTHTPAQATAALAEKADYIGFGPLFATPTKPDYSPVGLNDIAEVHRRAPLPVFCIGGIKLENLEQVIRAGARRVVIVSGLLQAAQIIRYASAARELLAQSKIENLKS
jgi:thiamine-phosphate pyrophosphorylase